MKNFIENFGQCEFSHEQREDVPFLLHGIQSSVGMLFKWKKEHDYDKFLTLYKYSYRATDWEVVNLPYQNCVEDLNEMGVIIYAYESTD